MGRTLGQAHASWLACQGSVPYTVPPLISSSSPASCLGPALGAALLNAQGTSGLRNQLWLSRSRDGCALPSCYGTSGDRWLKPSVLTQRGEGAPVQASPRSSQPVSSVPGYDFCNLPSVWWPVSSWG
ncbi:hypothetical protein HJG60_009662 [Phyllostomus discolor]|uniref:Uncharacterized protein n=1 Tax=Phyllostomus discolor TaxID=89673 RepID=A0A834B9P1_9CHIR|nr:hypothetical protein HJG60_009662 [Phyllostomus discolor]